MSECVKCLEERRIEARGLCRPCYRLEWRAGHREQLRKSDRARRLSHPGTASAQGRRWRMAHPYADDPARQEKARTRAQAWALAHPEQAAANKKRYAESHPGAVAGRIARWSSEHPEARNAITNRRRARIHATPCTLTAAEWIAILATYGYRCAYCGGGGIALEMEHVVPLSLGGGTTADNIVPSCVPCNRRKGAHVWEPMVAA